MSILLCSSRLKSILSSLQVPESQQKYILWEFTSSLQSWTTDVSSQYSLSFPSYIQSTTEIWLRCVLSFPTSSAYTSVYQTFITVHSVSCDSCLGLPGLRLSSLLLILFNMPESVLTRLTTSLHPASFQKWTNHSKPLFSICFSLVEVFFQSSNKYWMSTYYV